MISYRPEGPVVLKESAPLYDLAQQIGRWIKDPERMNRGWVAAVYGGRGSGKTSLLWTLRDLLKRESSALILPKGERDEALFSISQTRSDDELFALLVEFLARAYGKLDALNKIKRIDMRWHDRKRFVDYEQSMAANDDDLVDRLTNAYTQAACSTKELQDAFKDAFKEYQSRDQPAGSKKPLVLLVDDLDLQPHRALELLEIFRLFLNREGIIVLLAADRDLLIHNIDEGLKDKRTRQPGLAGALLGKLVPYSWMLPLPTLEERQQNLWSMSDDGEEPELPRWWRALSLTEDLEAAVRRDMGPLLPHFYRGLKALHNRLISLRQELLRRAEEPKDSDFLKQLGDTYRQSLGLTDPYIPSAFSMVAALDVRWPSLGILDALLQTPAEFIEALTVLALPKDDEEGGQKKSLSELSASDRQLPILDRLDDRWLAGRDIGEARRLLGQMASLWASWREFAAEAQTAARFFAVSLDNEALKRSEILWKERFEKKRLPRPLHLDLREFADPQREHPERLRKARKQAYDYLKEQSLGSLPGRLEMRAEAPRSLLVWLGWYLRYVEVAAYNYFSGTYSSYELPSRLPFLNRGTYDILQGPDEAISEVTGPNELVLLLDTLGRSNEEDLDKFIDLGGEPLSRWYRARLQTPAGWILTPDGLVALMQDVIEYLGRMKQEYDFQRIHMGLAVPDVVALSLGRQLNAWPIKLYEFNKTAQRYQYVFDLADPV